MKEELYYYWLDNVPGIGRITMRRLIEVISPRELYEQGAGAPGLPLREKQRKQPPLETTDSKTAKKAA